MHTRQSRPRCLLLLLWVALLPIPAFAQEEPENPAPEQTGESRPDSDNGPQSSADPIKQPGSSSTQQPDPVFRPSEEISEDLSVPFPVDI